MLGPCPTLFDSCVVLDRRLFSLSVRHHKAPSHACALTFALVGALVASCLVLTLVATEVWQLLAAVSAWQAGPKLPQATWLLWLWSKSKVVRLLAPLQVLPAGTGKTRALIFPLPSGTCRPYSCAHLTSQPSNGVSQVPAVHASCPCDCEHGPNDDHDATTQAEKCRAGQWACGIMLTQD